MWSHKQIALTFILSFYCITQKYENGYINIWKVIALMILYFSQDKSPNTFLWSYIYIPKTMCKIWQASCLPQVTDVCCRRHGSIFGACVALASFGSYLVSFSFPPSAWAVCSYSWTSPCKVFLRQIQLVWVSWKITCVGEQEGIFGLMVSRAQDINSRWEWRRVRSGSCAVVLPAPGALGWDVGEIFNSGTRFSTCLRGCGWSLQAERPCSVRSNSKVWAELQAPIGKSADHLCCAAMVTSVAFPTHC